MLHLFFEECIIFSTLKKHGYFVWIQAFFVFNMRTLSRENVCFKFSIFVLYVEKPFTGWSSDLMQDY